MAAWYVFTALGFYPVAPASNTCVIGRRFVPRATLTLPGASASRWWRTTSRQKTGTWQG
nr:glycoside hydrolase domain-containing protein [Luteimonas saliphila]